MLRIRPLHIVLPVAALLAAAGLMGIGQAQDQKPVKAVMVAKLKHAQGIIAGLAVQDFGDIRKDAEALSALSRAAEWQVHKNPEYVRFSEDFRLTCDDMAKHAREKNLDGCTLDYMQMTMLCVRCHKFVRDVAIAGPQPAGK